MQGKKGRCHFARLTNGCVGSNVLTGIRVASVSEVYMSDFAPGSTKRKPQLLILTLKSENIKRTESTLQTTENERTVTQITGCLKVEKNSVTAWPQCLACFGFTLSCRALQ